MTRPVNENAARGFKKNFEAVSDDVEAVAHSSSARSSIDARVCAIPCAVLICSGKK
jgi:hypothetical protein